MSEQITLVGTQLPTTSQVSMKIEVNTNVNVSAFVARQKANSFLILQIGDQLMAGEPALHIEKEISWRVPVFFAPSRQGSLGIVGHLLVNANTGEVSLADGLTVDDLIDRAEALYERAAL